MKRLTLLFAVCLIALCLSVPATADRGNGCVTIDEGNFVEGNCVMHRETTCCDGNCTVVITTVYCSNG